VDPFEQAVRLLSERGSRSLPFKPAFEALSPAEPGVVVAVDGSHAVLVDSGAAWVVAVSAGAARWQARPPVVEPEIVASGPGEAQGLLDERFARMGLEPPKARSAEAFAESLRGLAELETTLGVLGGMARGDLLLVDGALHGLPPAATAGIDLMFQEAEKRGVTIVGVAKRSGLELAGVSLVPAIFAEGSRRLPGQTWSCPVPGSSGTFVVRLHAAAPNAFRVDAVSHAELGRLLPLCRDAAYTGYPYPLAVVHNAVALTASRVADLRGQLETRLRTNGGPGMQLVDDFHAVLDRNL
jgi:NurA domain